MATRSRSATSSKFPVPTHWVERTPEGNPPTDVLLLLLGYREESEDYEAGTVLQSGFYSGKLGVFLNQHNEAIEQEAMITHYHIVHMPNGDLFML